MPFPRGNERFLKDRQNADGVSRGIRRVLFVNENLTVNRKVQRVNFVKRAHPLVF